MFTGIITDVGTVEVDVLPAPSDASRQDPDVELSGTLPATAWSMDVGVCFAASARYTY